MPEKSHYELLKVARGANLEEIEHHYHEALYQHHPDRNQGDEDGAMERTIALVTAFKVLSDPVERRKYDFQIGFQPLEEGQTKGLKLLKSKEKKEAELKFAEGLRSARAGDNARAVEAYKSALKLEPDFPEASHNLALLGALLGNATFAADVIARALKLSPEHPDLLKLRKGVQQAFS